MNRLEPSAYRKLLDVETARIAEIDPAGLGNPIPHIEGWTAHSVIGHTAWLLRFVTLNLAATPDEAPPRSSVGEPPVGPEVIGWFTEAVDELRTALDGASLDELHPSWTGPQPTSWWLRRLAQETAMHRWDAQAAVGEAVAIDTDLARDGIDEVLEVFAPHRLQFDVLAGGGETIHLHATDAPAGEWLLHLDATEVRWEHGHAKGEVAARGSMSDLLLLMWSRIPPARVEVFGEAELLERWQRAATF